jgi:sugar fermentation stimulation protein A
VSGAPPNERQPVGTPPAGAPYAFPRPLSPARLLARENRFVCRVLLDGEERRVHLPSTGRLGELLRPGATVWVDPVPAGVRTRGRLVAVGEELFAWRRRPDRLERRVALGGRGFADFLWRGRLVEVKGVTLYTWEGGRRRALFPDAPTARGRRQLDALAERAAAGVPALLAFELLGGTAEGVWPNVAGDSRFAEALLRAQAAGVALLGEAWRVTRQGAAFVGTVPVRLDPDA